MRRHKKKLLLAGLVSIILIIAGFFYFFVIDTKKIHADVGPGGGPACFNTFDCGPSYYTPAYGPGICGFGYGFANCTQIGNPTECRNCAINLEENGYNIERQCNPNSQGEGVCQIRINGGPALYNCYQCYDAGAPLPPGQPPNCDITENDYNHTFSLEDSNGNTVFAFTDAGQILTKMGISGVEPVGDSISSYFAFSQNDDYFPIYNQSGALIAFIGKYINEVNYKLYLKGGLDDYWYGELLPPNGSFIIKNSFGDVVSYIDSDGNLYLLGCVSENAHFVP